MSLPMRRPILAVLSIAIASALVAVPVSAAPFSGLQRLFRDVGLFQGLQITGSNELTFQQNLVEGSQSAYEGQRWDTDPIIRRSTIGLEGPIWKEFSFKADFSSSGYGPSYSRWVMGYIGNDTNLYYGDLNIDLSGNQFASFSKPVQGWQVDQKIGQGLMRAFYSKEKAITRFQTIPGNNTSGPFFLTYTPVMQGTEVVKLNEQIQEFGVDYRLDYDTGQLWFEVDGRPPKIIPDTATISISYQSAGFDSSAGTISGARLLMPLMGDRLQVGLTMLRQDRGAGGTRDTAGRQEDIFNGSGSTGPFDVNFRPILANGSRVVYQGEEQVIQQALVVLVDNVEQAEGVDYDAYRSIGRIIFRRSVPPTALVVIRYYYDLSTTLPVTNNDIMGLDLVYHLTDKIGLQAEYGKSNGGLATNSGDALRLNLAYNASKLRVVGEFRDISPTFTFMDSVGFYKQDKGLDIGVNWEPMEHVSIYARQANLQTAQGYSFGYSPYGGYGGGGGQYYGMQTRQGETDTSPSLSINSARTDVEMRLEFPNWPTLSLQRQQMSNTGGTSGNSDYASNNLSMSWTPQDKPFSLTANLYKTDQGFSQLDENDELISRGSTTQQLQWSAAYRPNDKFSISYNRGRNNSDSVGTVNRSSSDTDQLSLHWSPSRKIDLTYDQSNTNSVGAVSSGFYDYGTMGIGDGGGIDGGGDEETETNRYQDSSSRLGLRYNPSQKLSLDFSLMKRDYTSGGSVGYLADSSQITKSLSANYQLSDTLSFNATIANDDMRFLEEGRGAVTNQTMGMGANWQKPDSPWGLSLNFNKTTGQSPTYSGYGSSQQMRIVDNNMSDLMARLSYRMSEDSELSLTGQIADYAGGYANFNRQQVEIGFRRRLSDLADLNFGYRFSRNITGALDDPRTGNTSLTPQNQNYLANTFLLTLSTQFNSGVGGGGSGRQSWGGMGSSLSNFGGYRAGAGAMGNYGTNYGTGYSGFQGMGVFGQGGSSAGNFSSPYNSPFSSGGYGGSLDRPQGYETFGPSFGSGSNSGGFTGGLGDISGRQQGAGMYDLNNPPMGPPGQVAGPEGQMPEIEDWYELDDMNSIWW